MMKLTDVVKIIGSFYEQRTINASATFISALWALQGKVGDTLYHNWHQHHEIKLVEGNLDKVHLLKKGIVTNTAIDLLQQLPVVNNSLPNQELLIGCGYIFQLAESVLSCWESLERLEQMQCEELFTEEEILDSPSFVQTTSVDEPKATTVTSKWWSWSKWNDFFCAQFDACMHCINVYKVLTFDPIAQEDAKKRIFWNVYRVSLRNSGLIKRCFDYLVQTSSSSCPILKSLTAEKLFEVVAQAQKGSE